MRKAKGTGKVSPFRQPPPSSISSLGPVVILQLLPCIFLLQTCRTSSNSHLSGIRFRTNANERTSKVFCIVLLPSTRGTEVKVLCLQPWTFLSSDICWETDYVLIHFEVTRHVSNKAEALGLSAFARRLHLPIKPCLELAHSMGLKRQLNHFSILNTEQAQGNPNVYLKDIISQTSFGQLLLVIELENLLKLILSWPCYWVAFFLMESKMADVLFFESRIYSSLPCLIS